MAKLTNRFDADEAIVAAVANDSYRRAGNISITGLNRPPQMRVLEKRHFEEITEDVSDRLASLKGQIGHGILERAGLKNEWSEKRIGVTINGWEVTGQPDKFESIGTKDGVLIDFKLPTLSSFLFGFQRDKGLKPEWITQGNSYRYLLSKHGINVTKIVFKAILTEWSKRHARVKQGYPDRPFFNFDIPLWELSATENYLNERVKVHQQAEALPDDKLPECTNDERWLNAGIWKVFKDGAKKSLKNFDGPTAQTDAESFAAEKSASLKTAVKAIKVPGEAIRCVDYCRVAKWCHQLKREQPEGIEGII